MKQQKIEEDKEECEHAEVIKKGDRLFCEICREFLDETEYD